MNALRQIETKEEKRLVRCHVLGVAKYWRWSHVRIAGNCVVTIVDKTVTNVIIDIASTVYFPVNLVMNSYAIIASCHVIIVVTNSAPDVSKHAATASAIPNVVKIVHLSVSLVMNSYAILASWCVRAAVA